MNLAQKLKYRIRWFIWWIQRPTHCLACGDKITGKQRDYAMCNSCYTEYVADYEDIHEDNSMEEQIAQAESERDKEFDDYMGEQFYEEPDDFQYEEVI
jgi:hypothetical protein